MAYCGGCLPGVLKQNGWKTSEKHCGLCFWSMFDLHLAEEVCWELTMQAFCCQPDDHFVGGVLMLPLSNAGILLSAI